MLESIRGARLSQREHSNSFYSETIRLVKRTTKIINFTIIYFLTFVWSFVRRLKLDPLFALYISSYIFHFNYFDFYNVYECLLRILIVNSSNVNIIHHRLPYRPIFFFLNQSTILLKGSTWISYEFSHRIVWFRDERKTSRRGRKRSLATRFATWVDRFSFNLLFPRNNRFEWMKPRIPRPNHEPWSTFGRDASLRTEILLNDGHVYWRTLHATILEYNYIIQKFLGWVYDVFVINKSSKNLKHRILKYVIRCN